MSPLSAGLIASLLHRRRPRRLGVVLVAAWLAALAACLLNGWSLAAAGLAPRADAWSATVATLFAWGGLHAVVLTLMTAYLLARRRAGLLGDRVGRASGDNVALYWIAATVQAAIAIVIVHALPAVLG